MQVLEYFGELEPAVQDKIRYSSWKASDISKALREGRTPAPGGFGDDVGALVLSLIPRRRLSRADVPAFIQPQL